MVWFSPSLTCFHLTKSLLYLLEKHWDLYTKLTNRIREAFAAGDRELLVGTVEVDEAYISGMEKNKHAFRRSPEAANFPNPPCLAVRRRGLDRERG